MSKTISEELQGRPELRTLSRAITRARLDKLLSSYGEYTLFAPDNQALEREIAQQARSSHHQLVVQHLLDKQMTSAQLESLTHIENVFGSRISLTHNNTLSVGQARIIQADIMCSNGVIHIVDNTLNMQRR